MLIKTLFRHHGSLTLGEVEVKLLPGLPQLHLVGLPDAQIRECGLKVKSALRSSGLKWPKGSQIIVNLRPINFRKSSPGAELAVALGLLAVTGQLSKCLQARLKDLIIYGEVSLDGQVFAPLDFESAVHAFAGHTLLTGRGLTAVREGHWLEIAHLNSRELLAVDRQFSWRDYWVRPECPSLRVHPSAYFDLCLAAHAGLNVLVAGPHGSGKSTWAKALYTLTPPPVERELFESQAFFGEDVFKTRWRPCESPHHTITPMAMIGGGATLQPGVITRAHGGVLIMDEFLEFHPQVLESLREPIENGVIEHARCGQRQKYPAKFQLLATTNLCLCGKLNPARRSGLNCSHSLLRCRSICARLSGPIMDRFELLVFTHAWTGMAERLDLAQARKKVTEMAEFARQRGEVKQSLPAWIQQFDLSHRRHRSLLRVARALADFASSQTIQDSHFQTAYCKVVEPMQTLAQLFA